MIVPIVVFCANTDAAAIGVPVFSFSTLPETVKLFWATAKFKNKIEAKNVKNNFIGGININRK